MQDHQTTNESFDIIIIGGGHAGCEAAITTAKLGFSTALFTINLDRIAWQPCNPAVGGPAKSQLVHEVDALGGICLLYTSPSPRDRTRSRMPSSA